MILPNNELQLISIKVTHLLFKPGGAHAFEKEN